MLKKFQIVPFLTHFISLQVVTGKVDKMENKEVIVIKNPLRQNIISSILFSRFWSKLVNSKFSIQIKYLYNEILIILSIIKLIN